MPWELLYVVKKISNDFLFSKEVNKTHNSFDVHCLLFNIWNFIINV